METESRLEIGSAVIRSAFYSALGLLFIGLGMSFLPIIGILVGAVLLGVAVYPWMGSLRQRQVKVLIGSVTSNNLEPRRIPVAILSATKQRDGFDFDPRRVDPSSAVFGPLKARPLDDVTDPAAYERSLVDINEDGVPDLLLYFSGDEAGVGAEAGKLCLSARTLDGERIVGCNAMEFGYESGLVGKLEYV